MADLPIMPLKTDAILADTTHMTAEEFGVYCRLLFVMWRQEAKLPDDDTELALIGGVTKVRWKAIKEKVMRPMTAIGGIVTQKRLTTTWTDVQAKRRKLATSGDKGRETQKSLRQMQPQMPRQMPPHPPPDSLATAGPWLTKTNNKLTTVSDDAEAAGLAKDSKWSASPQLLASLKPKGYG